MAQTISFTSPYDAELEALDRRQKLAEVLQQRSAQPIQGQMAGRVYAPPSWTQGLAQLVQAYGARKGMQGLDERRKAIAEERNQKLVEALTKARQPNADPIAELSANPDTAGAAMGLWGQQLSAETAAKAAQELERIKQANKITTVAPGAAALQGGQVIHSQPGRPPAGYKIGPDGQPVLDTDYWAQKQAIAEAGRSSTNVTVDQRGPVAFETELGKGAGMDLLARRTSAQDAADTIRTTQEGLKLLDAGMITGKFADFKLGAGKALQQIGINLAPDPIANTEAFVASQGANVGRIIKMFGSGTGLSNADREYAEKIVAGKIELNEESLRRIMDINMRGSRNVIKRYNADASQVRKGVVPFDLNVEEPMNAELSPAEQAEYDALKAKLGGTK